MIFLEWKLNLMQNKKDNTCIVTLASTINILTHYLKRSAKITFPFEVRFGCRCQSGFSATGYYQENSGSEPKTIT